MHVCYKYLKNQTYSIHHDVGIATTVPSTYAFPIEQSRSGCLKVMMLEAPHSWRGLTPARNCLKTLIQTLFDSSTVQEDTPKQWKMRHFKMNRKTTVRVIVIVIPSSPSKKYILNFCCKTFAIFGGPATCKIYAFLLWPMQTQLRWSNFSLATLTLSRFLKTAVGDVIHWAEWPRPNHHLSSLFGWMMAWVGGRVSMAHCMALDSVFVHRWCGTKGKHTGQSETMFPDMKPTHQKMLIQPQKKSDVGVYIAACIHLHPNPVYTPWPKKKKSSQSSVTGTKREGVDADASTSPFLCSSKDLKRRFNSRLTAL